MSDAGSGGDHYFTADPSVPFRRTALRARVWGHELPLVSGSGVFAQGRVDRGTTVLLRTTEPAPTARVFLDLGCGYGVVAAVLATCRPQAQVWAVDVNERALLLTKENAAALGLEGRLQAVTPDRVPPGIVFDEIWSNPPIRIGKGALHALLRTWLPRLDPQGRAVLVVAKNLGADSLQRWLIEQGFPTTRLASAQGFRVLEITRG